MYTRITVALDGSPTAERALRVAAAAASRAGLPLDLVSVIEAGDDVDEQERRSYLAGARGEAAAPSGSDEVLHGDAAAAVLVELAADPTRLLCLTSNARPLGELFIGSVTSAVVRESPNAVLVVGRAVELTEAQGLESLVVCIDGSAESESMIPPALDWAKQFGGTCWLLRVLEADGARPGEVPDTEYVRHVAKAHEGAGVELAWDTVRGAPAASIVGFADSLPAPVIALTSHRHITIGRLTLGSVAEAVIHDSPGPVLICRLPG